MQPILLIYDDTVSLNALIRDTVGERSFGEVLIRRETVGETMRAFFLETLPDAQLMALSHTHDLNEFIARIAARRLLETTRTPVVHFYSDFIVRDRERAAALLKKCVFAERKYILRLGGRTVLRVFPDLTSYIAFLEAAAARGATESAPDDTDGRIQNCEDAFAGISTIDGFVSSVCDEYDVRFFNAVTSDEYTVTKRSANKDKLAAEYAFWRYLPDEMKPWFVMPYDFEETANGASYRMERLHMPNLAVKYVHGAMKQDEFAELMELYFRFFSIRASRAEEQGAFISRMRSVYISKVHARVAQLKALPQYERFAALVRAGTAFLSIDALVARYIALFEQLTARAKLPCISVVGHGDPGFANALFHRETKTLKFVDPKGAVKADDMWADPYYDVVKLSHCVCGRYDFFNSGRFDISLNGELLLQLEIPFDNASYVRIFRERVQANGFDFTLVRLFEASLFLSMLPLHIDDPRKVLGFLLNAARILDEVERHV